MRFVSLFLIAAGLALAASWRVPAPVPFQRIRVEYATSSDWSTLELRDPVLSMKLMESRGQDVRARMSGAQLLLNQPIDSARAGAFVGMVVDLALPPGTSGTKLRVLLKKGALNSSTVRVSNVTAGDPVVLAEVEHKGTVPGQTGTNPLEVTVDLGPLASAPIGNAQIQPFDLERTAWAFYYPWYRMSDWDSKQLRDHPAQRYSSNDPAAIARQIEQAQRAGIDGFISSWWGPGHYTDQNLQLLLDAANDRDFKVTIYLETLTGDGARSEDELNRWLAYLPKYTSHPAWMRAGGKPLIVVWASGAAPLEMWQRVLARARDAGLDAVYLGMGLNASNLAVFDGIHEYGVFNIQGLGAAFSAAANAVRYYPLLGGAAKIWAATAQPGYDDRLIPGRAGALQERNDGAFYRSTLADALASDPDWLFLTSWSEWWEHTYIEPGELYGEQYLDITREFVSKWKRKRIDAIDGPVTPGQPVTIRGVEVGPDDGDVSRVQVLFDGIAGTVNSAQTDSLIATPPDAIAARPSVRVQVYVDRLPSNEVAAPGAPVAAPAAFPLRLRSSN